MGTSASHKGPKSSISLDPPWLDDIDTPDETGDPSEQDVSTEEHTSDIPLLAPPARFKTARRYMGDYLRSGNHESLVKSLGHYSHTGMGGSRNLAKRMRHSAIVASKLFFSLSALREGNEPTISNIINRLRAANADIFALADAIAEYLCGDDGSLDEKAPNRSISSALSDLLLENPNIDITALTDDTIWSLVTSYLSYEAYSRLQLDLGQVFESVNPSECVNRLTAIREYLESEISSQINALRSKSGFNPMSELRKIMTAAIDRTFYVFEVAI